LDWRSDMPTFSRSGMKIPGIIFFVKY
jgi:hypothetical protein